IFFICFYEIHTNYEFSITMAASLTAAMGNPSIGVDVAVLMRDKYLQKQRLTERGVDVARARVFRTAPEPKDVADFGFPVVLKPTAGAGTESTEKVDDPGAFTRAVTRFFAGAAGKNGLLVEQYIDGEEYILDGWVTDGRVEFASLGRYSRPCLDTVTMGENLRMYRCTESTHPNLAARATQLASDSLAALGLRTGLFHLEFFRTADDRLVFSECAARRGGASIEEEVRHSRATSLAAASLDLCLGSAPTIGSDEPLLEVGTVHPKLTSGVVLDLPRTSQLLEMPGVEYTRYFSYLGATTSGSTTSTSDRDAVFLVGAGSLGELDGRLDAVEAAFLSQAIVSPNRTPGDMRGFQHTTLGRDDLIDHPFPVRAVRTVG
ncbi:acetyl-CoA carboxylase biotin carboxylase subunit family protein, partial [Nocardia sp. NPDC058497]|uniref:ATP-grasp domain-containing protein n=1 Tax=Nocardia sp. NPDC058497 TaxID=3346529 RepID=UPI00364CDD0B